MNGKLTINNAKFQRPMLLLWKSGFSSIAPNGTADSANPSLRFPLPSLQCGSILKSLTNSKSLMEGRKLHAHVTTSGSLIHNTYLSTKLSAFYASCGEMETAEIIFNGVQSKSSFLWNFMIRGYASSGVSRKALALYREMLRSGLKADNFNFPFVVKACGDLLKVRIGRKVHGEVVVCGFESDVYVGNSLIAMYSKCGAMVVARKVFDKMPVRDLTSWNSMISGYVKNGMAGEALTTFRSMKEGGVLLDGTTLLGVLSCCAELLMLKQGKEVHGYVLRNGHAFYNTFLENSLVELYCQCSSMDCAKKLFETMAMKKDTVSWNSLIAGYARREDSFESLRAFNRMVSEGFEPDQVTYVTVLGVSEKITSLQFGMSLHASVIKLGFFGATTTMVATALIDMYAKCGSLACSRLVFDEMHHHRKNLVSWSAMISGYRIHGRAREAIELFNRMVDDETGIVPDEGVLTSVLSACSHGGLVNEGREIFNNIRTPAMAHYSCYVDLLSRSGRLTEAHKVIGTMEIDPSVDVWAALLNGCRLHNNLELAEIAASEIVSLNPNNVSSYVSLANVYAAEKRWGDVERVRLVVRSKGLTKPPGCSSGEPVREPL